MRLEMDRPGVTVRLGRFYVSADDGSGVYYLDGNADEGYGLHFIPRRPDGYVEWSDLEGIGEVDFFRIEPEYAEQAREAGRLLCKRAGLSETETRFVLGLGGAE